MKDHGDGARPVDTRNDELDAMHRGLVALVVKLELAVDEAATAAQVKALGEQIVAANVRVTAIGRELFARRTKEISTAAAAVSARIPKVEDALADLARLDAFVANMTGMLKLVDHAVETARMAA